MLTALLSAEGRAGAGQVTVPVCQQQHPKMVCVVETFGCLPPSPLRLRESRVDDARMKTSKGNGVASVNRWRDLGERGRW